jgi:hypothetical protein
MIERERQLHFTDEILVICAVLFLGKFKRDTCLVYRVRGGIDVRQWTRRDASDNSIFTEFLPRA